MILATILSKNKIPIRLTEERWLHIITSHKELTTSDLPKITNAIKNPDAILKGDTGEFLAIKKKPGKKTWIVVAYKEIGKQDGFVVTAYITTDSRWLFKKDILWNKT